MNGSYKKKQSSWKANSGVRTDMCISYLLYHERTICDCDEQIVHVHKKKTGVGGWTRYQSLITTRDVLPEFF